MEGKDEGEAGEVEGRMSRKKMKEKKRKTAKEKVEDK